MLEEALVTARGNPKIDPSLGIWSWEVPMYLFLGGLTAGAPRSPYEAVDRKLYRNRRENA